MVPVANPCYKDGESDEESVTEFGTEFQKNRKKILRVTVIEQIIAYRIQFADETTEEEITEDL
jgi:hypothetical protein